jgi:CubicO group peptidase (beta-lactamase class C family)
MYSRWLVLMLMIAWLLTAAGELSANRGRGAAESPSLTLEERMRRVEEGLVPIVAGTVPRWKKKVTLVERMAHYDVAGVGIAVINDFEIEWAEGYGILEAGGGQAVTSDTLFHAGSLAKGVSAAAVLTLVEEGLLDLDEDVNDKLTSWQVPGSESTVEEQVTLRRLLSHSAGLKDGFTDRSSNDALPTYLAPAGKAPTVTLPELLRAVPGVDVDGATYVAMIPGSEYRYANADYAIVELLVEDVMVKPFPEFMRETVLDPLGMTSSTFEQPLPEDLRARATTEHDVDGQPLGGKRLHFPYRAAGGLWTTPSDLARFAIEIMLAYNGQSDALLSQELAREMLAPQIAVKKNPFSDAYGLGFHLAGEGQEFAFQHTGGTWGSTCLIWMYPESGQGAVIMTNSASGQGAIRFETLFGLAREYGWPLAK